MAGSAPFTIVLDKIEINALAQFVEKELVRPENELLKRRFKEIYRFEKRFYSLVIRKVLLRQESFYLRHVRESKGFQYIHRNMFFGDLYCLNFATSLILQHKDISRIIQEICEIDNKSCNSNLEIIARKINDDQKKLQEAYTKEAYSILSFFTPDVIQFERPDVFLARKEYIKSRIKSYVRLMDAPGNGWTYSEMIKNAYSESAYYEMRDERIAFAEKMFDSSFKNISKAAEIKEGDRIKAELRLSKDITVKILKKRKYHQIISKKTENMPSIFAQTETVSV